MKECIRVLRCLVNACEDLLEGMQTQGLDRDGYGDVMDEARIFTAQAYKLFVFVGRDRSPRPVPPDYLDKLTADDRGRLCVAFNQCWDQHTYDSSPVDILLAEFREKYDD